MTTIALAFTRLARGRAPAARRERETGGSSRAVDSLARGDAVTRLDSAPARGRPRVRTSDARACGCRSEPEQVSDASVASCRTTIAVQRRTCEPVRRGRAADDAHVFHLPTSDQVRLPAEFKHINKRRKRN